MTVVALICYFQIWAIFSLVLRLLKIDKRTSGKLPSVKQSRNEQSVYCMTVFESLLFFWDAIQANNLFENTSLGIFHKLFAKNKTVLFNFPAPILMSGDNSTVKEIQNSEIWADRPIGKLFSQRSIGKSRGILVNNGASWKILRKYTMKKLCQLGFRKKDLMTDYLEEELLNLISRVDCFARETSNKVPIHDLFSLGVLNIVWRIVAGEKFSQDDSHYNVIMKNTTTITTFPVAKILLYEFKPLQRVINYAPNFFGYADFFNALANLRVYFTEVIKSRQLDRSNGKSSEDFIETFLEEIDRYGSSNNSNANDLSGIYCVEELVTILTDLFQAGMDTTSNTLEGAIMLMIKFPKVQARIQKEIDEVIGENRFPSYFQDKQKMPYTVAAINEVHRMTNIGIFNGRAAKEDCTVGNIKIKKGTIGFLQLHYLRMDEKFWENPLEFKPERFISSNSHSPTENINRIVAFGGGVRACPGEIVAISTIFTFLTGLLQRYSFSKASDSDELRMRNHASLTNRVLPFTLSVTLRNNKT